MKSTYHDRLVELNAQIIDNQDLLVYWMGKTHPSQIKEALGHIAVLKKSLASLRVEQKAFFEDLKYHS